MADYSTAVLTENRAIVMAFWKLDKRSKTFVQKRLSKEKVAAKKRSQIQRDKATKRWKKTEKPDAVANAGAMPEECPDDASISISISTSSEGKPSAADAAILDVEKAADNHLWSAGKTFLISRGVPKGQAGSIIGKWKGEHGTGKVIEAIGRAQAEPDLVDPIPFINRVLQNSRGRNFTPAGKEYLGV